MAKVLHTLDFAGQQRAAALLAGAGVAPPAKTENRYDKLLDRLNNLEDKFTKPKVKRMSNASGSKTPTPPDVYRSRSRTPTPPMERVEEHAPVKNSNAYAGNVRRQRSYDLNSSNASAEGIAMAANWQKMSQAQALEQQRKKNQPAHAMMDQSATHTNHPMGNTNSVIGNNSVLGRDQSVTRTNHVMGLDQSVTNTNHNFAGGVSTTSTAIVGGNNKYGRLEETNTNHQANVVTARGQTSARPVSEATTVAANINPRNAGIHPEQGVIGGGFSTFGTNANHFGAAAASALGAPPQNQQPSFSQQQTTPAPAMNLSEQGAQAFLQARDRETQSSLQETLEAPRPNVAQRQEDARFQFGRQYISTNSSLKLLQDIFIKVISINFVKLFFHICFCVCRQGVTPSIMEESVLMQSQSTAIDGIFFAENKIRIS